MRVYDLDKNLEDLIADGKYQIDIIGEDGFWTVTVSRREWSNELQRYKYQIAGACTTPTFLGAYDFAAGIIGKA